MIRVREQNRERRGRPPSNKAVLTHFDLLGGLDYLAANYRRQDFPRHTHDEYLIGLIESGVHDVWCRGQWWHANAGSIATFAPSEPHFGGAGSEAGWSQKILYLPEQLVHEVLQDMRSGSTGTLGFNQAFHHDPAVTLSFRRLLWALESNTSVLEIEEKLHEVLPQLFSQYSGLHRRVGEVAPAALKRAREYIHAYSDKSIHLGDLAALTDLPKGSVIESFKKYYGVTPQHYLIQVRIDTARRLLRNGVAITEAAYAAGFADQSHLTRHFRAILGVTPARYIVT